MKKNYTAYNSEDFASEEAFVEWVLHDVQAEAWERWIVENPGVKGKVDQARKLIEAMEFHYIPLPTESKEKMWQEIDLKTTDGETTLRSSRTKVVKIGSWITSAAAVMLLAWMIFKPGNLHEIYVEPKDTFALSLPDASTIQINADSKVCYNRKKYSDRRFIELEGEAFFNVEKGNQFIVDLGKSEVEVLGTSFNIFHRKDSVAVKCFTGKVRVSHEGREVILSPGEMVAFSQLALTLEDQTFVMDNLSPQWIKGVYEYNNQGLIPVLKEIERQYDVLIDYDREEINKIRFSGTFENRMPLESVLETVCWPFNLSFEISGRTVKIYK
jgi:ferric-dicitrate binding protein FerR (iron transport regulator)